MANGTIQIDYELMAEVAKRFEQQAEVSSQIEQQLRQQLQTLENGGWEGEGSQAFFAEMNDAAMPALQRLSTALQQGSAKMQEVGRVFHEAEQATSRAAGGTVTGRMGAPPISGFHHDGQQGQMKPTVARPIPRPQGTEGYVGFPGSGGGYIKDAGNSSIINRTAESLIDRFESIEGEQERLDATRGVFDDTMREEGQDVEVAKEDLAKNLPELNKKNGRVHELIQEYRREGREALAADARVVAAENRVDAAISNNAAAKAVVEQYEASTQKESLEARRKALEQSIARKTQAMSKIYDFAAATLGGNPLDWAKGEASKLVKDTLVGTMADQEVAKLAVIDSKIRALDEAISSAKGDEVKNQLAATKAELEAAFNDSIAAKLDARIHKIAQWGTLDELARIEKDHGQGTLFRELQDYNSQVRHAATALREQSEAYIDTLNSQPLSRAGEMVQRVEADMRDVENYGYRKDEAWEARARNTKGYFESVEQWRQGELRNHRQLRNTLNEGRHLDLIDQTMSEAEKALGGTVHEDHL